MAQAFEVRDPNFESRIKTSFAKQGAMSTLGASLGEISPGSVELLLGYSLAVTQQHGFVHAGVVTTLMDSACGYAAYSLMPVEASVLTVEMKTNLLAPADGETFRMIGTVIKSGRTITFCEGQAFARKEGEPDKLIATMSATMMAIVNRPNVNG